jgi:predicted acyl esterase
VPWIAFHADIPETKFVPLWSIRLRRGRNRKFTMAEEFLAEQEAHPLDDGYWASKRPVLESIEVPALVCMSWSDHGLHNRGSIVGFERISCKQKWLFTPSLPHCEPVILRALLPCSTPMS